MCTEKGISRKDFTVFKELDNFCMQVWDIILLDNDNDFCYRVGAPESGQDKRALSVSPHL